MSMIEHMKQTIKHQAERIAELEDAANKYIAEKENIVPDATMIRHTFKRLKEVVAPRQGNEEGKQE